MADVKPIGQGVGQSQQDHIPYGKLEGVGALTAWMAKRIAWLAVAGSRCGSSPKPHGSGYPVDSWQATGVMQSVLQLSGFFDSQRASAL